jgi:hypothetical protein
VVNNLVLRCSHAPRELITGSREKRMPNGTWLGLRSDCNKPNDPRSASDYANYESRCLAEEPPFSVRFRSVVKITSIPAMDGEEPRLDGWILTPGSKLSPLHQSSYEGLTCVGTIYSINGVHSSPAGQDDITPCSTPETFTGTATCSPADGIDRERIDSDIAVKKGMVVKYPETVSDASRQPEGSGRSDVSGGGRAVGATSPGAEIDKAIVNLISFQPGTGNNDNVMKNISSSLKTRLENFSPDLETASAQQQRNMADLPE